MDHQKLPENYKLQLPTYQNQTKFNANNLKSQPHKIKPKTELLNGTT